MAEIYVPGAIDIMGSANQMMQFRNSQQAQQANALQMQYAAEDRARAAQERKAAAGNALTEQARKRELLEIYGNYGATPAPGGTGTPYDPLATLQNRLLLRGFSSEAGNVAELKNKNLTGEKTTADTKFVTAQTDKEQSTILSNYITLHKEQLNSAPDYDTAIALTIASYTPGHPMAAWLAKNGVSQEQAVTELIRRRDEGIPFEETRALMARGATNAAQDAATLAQSQAAARSSDAAATSSLATAAKTKYEMDNPGFTIESVQTATGPIRVRVDKKTGALTPLTLDGKTVAPEVTPVPPTDLEKLQDLEAKLRAANPNDPRLADVRNAIVKLTTQAPGQTININQIQETELEKSLGKGQGEVALKSQATAQDAADMINTIKIGRGLIQQGIVTGFGADFRVDLGRALKLAGIETGDDAVANTQAFAATMAQNVGKLIKQFGAGTGLSDADREYAIKMAGGQITLDEGAIKKILDINERAAKNTIEQHNKKYGGIKTTVPLTVDVPSDITSNATNSTSVITPDGKTHNFPSAEAAAQFKKAAGIQ